jgi:hypothetical protein
MRKIINDRLRVMKQNVKTMTNENIYNKLFFLFL